MSLELNCVLKKPSIVTFILLVSTICCASPVERTLLISLWENQEEKASLRDVLQEDVQVLFDQQSLETINFGFNDHEYWLRFKVVRLEADQPYVLSIDHPSLTHVTLFRQQDGEWITKEGGHEISPLDREVSDIHPSFLIKELSAEEVFYVRVSTTGSVSLPIKFRSFADYVQDKVDFTLFLGVFYGLMLVMSVYNFILFINLGDRSYIFYVGATIFGLLTSFVLNGLGYQYFWPNNSQLDQHIYLTFAGFSILFSSRFAAEFLQVKARFTSARWFLWGVSLGSILLVILSFFYDSNHLLFLGRVIVLIAFPGYLFIGILSYRRGFRPAKYYVIAWIPYILGLVATVLRGGGWVPESFFAAYGIEIGGGLEAMLLSLALANRIKLLRTEVAEKELEKEQFKMKVMREQQSILEKQVADRTHELTLANATKDKFFSIIAHDLRGPMIGLQGIGQKFDYFVRKGRKEKLLELGNKVDASIDQLNHLLNNLLSWAASQTHSIPYHLVQFELNDLLSEVINLYKGIAESSDVTITYYQTQALVHGDRNSISTIFRNLVSNAIKFSPKGGEVRVTVEDSPSWTIVVISDDGPGISPENLKKLRDQVSLSTLGKRGEKGFGLGLRLSQEFVKMNQGEMEILSKSGEGSIFRVTLPAQKT